MERNKPAGNTGLKAGAVCLAAGFLLGGAAAVSVRGWMAAAAWSALACMALGIWLSVREFRLQSDQSRKRAEALESRVAALNREHAKRLKEMQQQSQREMETFRSTISHSLRMPIAIIQGYADLLAGDVATDPEVRRRYLEKIIQRTNDMTDVLGRKIPRGGLSKRNLNCTHLDLLHLVRQTAEDMRTAAGERAVRIQVISKEKELPIVADEYLISRVLFNLLENALKYMGRPGTVSIRVQREEDKATLSIQDDGFGISEKEVGYIFEMNYQGSNRTSGQGYGLYMVRQIVEAHGGTVFAQSKVGKGLGVHIELPLTQPLEEQEETEKAAAAQN